MTDIIDFNEAGAALNIALADAEAWLDAGPHVEARTTLDSFHRLVFEEVEDGKFGLFILDIRNYEIQAIRHTSLRLKAQAARAFPELVRTLQTTKADAIAEIKAATSVLREHLELLKRSPEKTDGT